MTLTGKVALVTGGAGGLGRGIAKALAGAGADVAICDIDRTALAAAERELTAQGGRCLALRCDVS